MTKQNHLLLTITYEIMALTKRVCFFCYLHCPVRTLEKFIATKNSIKIFVFKKLNNFFFLKNVNFQKPKDENNSQNGTMLRHPKKFLNKKVIFSCKKKIKKNFVSKSIDLKTLNL